MRNVKYTYDREDYICLGCLLCDKFDIVVGPDNGLDTQGVQFRRFLLGADKSCDAERTSFGMTQQAIYYRASYVACSLQ